MKGAGFRASMRSSGTSSSRTLNRKPRGPLALTYPAASIPSRYLLATDHLGFHIEFRLTLAAPCSLLMVMKSSCVNMFQA